MRQIYDGSYNYLFLALVLIVTLMNPTVLFAEIKNIVSSSGSPYRVETPGGVPISDNHSTIHKAMLSAIEYIESTCEVTCEVVVKRELNLRVIGNKAHTEQPPAEDPPDPIEPGLVRQIVSWQHSNTYRDGSRLSVEDIGGYIIYWELSNGERGSEDVGKVLEHSFYAPPGVHRFWLRAYSVNHEMLSTLSEYKDITFF